MEARAESRAAPGSKPGRSAGRSRAVVGWMLLLVALLCAGVAWANTESFEAGDWQYESLDALSQAGLLRGHPQGPLSDWTDEISRYEAASLTVRAIEGIGLAYEEQGQSLQQIVLAPAAEEGTTTDTAAAEPPATVGPGLLLEVRKLIEEFRAELVAMGVRVDDLETALADVQERVSDLEAERQRHRLDGYMQLRYQDDNAPAGREEFLVRRARFNIRGPVSERVAYRLELQLDAREDGGGPTSKTQVRTANVDYQLGSTMLRFGQAKIPFGYELLESVPNLWSGERSLMMDRLFPDQRDIGIQASYRRSPEAPQVDVGIFNGTGINAYDNNDRKNIMARVDFPLPAGSAALSVYRGSDDEGAEATRQDRTGVSAQYQWCKTQFLSEFISGHDAGHDIRGWYGQLGHPVCASRQDLLFVKYDTYDENRDAADDLFRRWTVGYWWNLDRATRVTVFGELRSPQRSFSQLSKWDGNAAFLQVQVRY